MMAFLGTDAYRRRKFHGTRCGDQETVVWVRISRPEASNPRLTSGTVERPSCHTTTTWSSRCQGTLNPETEGSHSKPASNMKRGFGIPPCRVGFTGQPRPYVAARAGALQGEGADVDEDASRPRFRPESTVPRRGSQTRSRERDVCRRGRQEPVGRAPAHARSVASYVPPVPSALRRPQRREACVRCRRTARRKRRDSRAGLGIGMSCVAAGARLAL